MSSESATKKKIVDDDEYGPIRAEICDAYIAAGKPQPEINWLYSRLVETKAELRDCEYTLELIRRCDLRAIERWRKEKPGRELRQPDGTEMIVWMLEKLGW